MTPRARLERIRAAQVDGLREGQSGRALAGAFSDAMQSLVEELAGPPWSRESSNAPVALVAIGGLARRELAPHSDLDLVLLVERVTPAGVDPLVRALVHPMWDLGLKVNLVVHDPQSWIAAAADDLTSATAMLDARPILGHASLLEGVRETGLGPRGSPARTSLLARIEAEVRERHDRFGGTVFLVEPDLKFGPGGLRDISTARWSLDLAHDGLGLEGLSEAGVLPPAMTGLLVEAHDTLLRLRAGLQVVARRAQDRLVFSYQEALPALFGEIGTDVEDQVLVTAVEAMMQRYYRAASAALRCTARVRDRCRPALASGPSSARRVDERFEIVDGRLSHDASVNFDDTPMLGLEALALARGHGVLLRAETADAIAESVACGAAAGLRGEPEAHRRILDLLSEAEDLTAPSALYEVAELGLLEAVIPAFAPIRGRMQHDTFHVFTVDQHTLAAIALLKAIARGEHNKDFPLATALHLEIDDPTVLYLATLCHDMGKATTGDQCETGAAIATDVASALGLLPEQVQRCAMLVREHLTMPRLAFKRDLGDPDLIAEFAEQVGNRPTLRELYLLSLVDTASVRPGNLTSWKLTLLDELYLLTSARLHRRRSRSQRIVPRAGEPESMPGRYYSLFHQDMRRHHGELIDGLFESGREAALDMSTGSGALRLTLVARDRPGLLAQAMAVLDDHGIEVMAADIFTAPGPPPVALDVFRVVAKEGPEHGVDVQTLTEIEDALQTGVPPQELEQRPRPRHRFGVGGGSWRTEIRFDADASGRRTIVEVETRASPDVLRRVTRAFAAEGVEILLARCGTEAARASNVFYVPELDQRARLGLAQRLRDYLA